MNEKKYPQAEYDKKWREQNKEHYNYLRKRSTARSFIRNSATLEDLEELKGLISERENLLNNFS